MKQMRIWVLATALLWMGFQALAQQRSAEEMQKIALRALGSKGYDRTKMSAGQPRVKMLMTSPELGIYSREGGGWVIVSGDCRTTSDILAYSKEGSFEWEKAPENVKRVIAGYESQIQFLQKSARHKGALSQNGEDAADPNGSISGGQQEDDTADEGRNEATPVVGPLLTTKWNQEEPYNMMCPKRPFMFKEWHSVAGCVATAMAQVMNYWKWPKRGCGIHTDAQYSSETVDFSQSVYDWDHMLDEYVENFVQREYIEDDEGYITDIKCYGNWDDAQVDAVTKLMYDCGVASNMDYGLWDEGGSGTITQMAKMALCTYFDYSSDIEYMRRDDYQGNWDNLLRSELDARRPMVYSGCVEELTEGHAFVCDGYDDQGYFHFNFGFSGEDDGYYLTSAICLPKNNSDFSYSQECVIGIHPAGKDDKVIWQDGMCFKKTREDEAELLCTDNVDETLEEAVVPDEVMIAGKSYPVTNIADGAFYFDSKKKSVTIGRNVRTLENHVFLFCSSLEEINLGRSVEKIGIMALSGTALKEFTIPSSVKELGMGAFQECTLLESITIGDGIKKIDRQTFYKCSSLEKVNFGKAVESLGLYAFCRTGLKEVVIPPSVKEIGLAAFWDNLELRSVVIGEGVKSIDQATFWECPRLTEMTCLATTPPESGEEGDLFHYTPVEQATLYVPKGCKTLYESAPNWNEFGTIKEIDATKVEGIENAGGGENDENAVYNLAGQKVNNKHKGIVITKGKKELR